MKKRILIIGCGFGGMWSALAAMRVLDEAAAIDDVAVTVIAPEPRVHIRPRLYETDLSTLAPSVEALFANVGVQFVRGYVRQIRDWAKHVIYVDDAGKEAVIAYDKLVLASGSTLFRPDVPGLAEHAFDVDQLAGAARLDAHLRTLASLPDSPARNTVVIAGGGFTGIETAAEMPARMREVLGPDVDVNVLVVERNDDIGPDLGPNPRPVIETALSELGVTLRLGTGVTSIDAHGVSTSDGGRIESMTVIWTAGLRSSELTAHIPGERDALGRLRVDRHLRVPGVPDVFAAGDTAAAATDDVGNVTVMSCQHAMNLGRSAGYNVARDLLGLPLRPYAQEKYVTCLDLGPWGAVYTEGWDRQVMLTGAEAKAMKRTINTEWIYPPSDDRAEALALSDPTRVVVA